ncbi:MAG TPA: MFS transporter [Ignavibacteriaceae bacterium]|nr:MFS transporter [Ignavibacteriaceae bacterium]
MAEEIITPEKEEETVLKQTIKEITQPFKDLVRASRLLWGVNISYFLEGLVYFGMLGLLALYFNNYAGLNDIQADQMVGILTAGITLSMLFLGATVDIIGVRKSFIISLSLMLVGRVLITLSPDIFSATGMWSGVHSMAMFGILWIVLGYGIYQPAAYAAVKRFTTKKNAAMGYAMLYALMNLGGFMPGLISPPVRKAFGITGVFWVYDGLTLAGIIVVAIVLSKKTIRRATEQLSDEQKQEVAEETEKPFKEKVKYYIQNFPLKDLRFMYFIFILIPVQTLFAHNWLTLPQYTSRAFTGFVQDNFEFFVNFNPILIFILTPMIAALTAKKDAYKMTILGTLVMASPTFILALGPNIFTLFAFIIIMTIGEAMWQPRFLQWVAEIAPKGMTGIYMGIGQFPWFLTKVVTAMYAGWFLMKYCPEGVPPAQMDTETMWFIYGLIAMISPIGLWLSRKWMIKGFKTKAA